MSAWVCSYRQGERTFGVTVFAEKTEDLENHGEKLGYDNFEVEGRLLEVFDA